MADKVFDDESSPISSIQTSSSTCTALNESSTPNRGANNTCDRLLKRLFNLESTILQLITLGKPSLVLKEKLLLLDEFILDIDDDQTELAKFWSDKAASWWKTFAVLCTAAEEENNNGNNKVNNRRKQGVIGGDRRGNENTFRGSSDQTAGGGNHGSRVYNNGTPPSKEEREKVLSTLVGDFSSLPAITGDLATLKRLFGVVRKARTQTHPFDSLLKEEVFCLAYRKLSPEKREKFIEQYGSSRMLVNMANFLRDQVDTFIQDQEIFHFNSFNGGDNRRRSWGATANGQGTINSNECRYCHEEGHHIADCPERSSKLCYNCNQLGHTSKYCKAEKKVIVTVLDGPNFDN